MLLATLKCQMCGNKFEMEVIDRDDPDERHRQGDRIRCTKCNSDQVEVLQKRRAAR
jgi:DNA-directed RNA polymerase subunit RPC12/RpoP